MAQPPPTRLALIGMSGIGKSYWSKQLEQAGFVRYDCDAMIAERLGELIELRDGEDAVLAVGRWMGMPWTAGYAEREAEYLELEREVTSNALDAMANLPGDQPAVLDTTGSVIYTGDALLTRLKQQCRVVYLEAPDSVRERMVKLYVDEPKPVLWQGGFIRSPGESEREALSNSYDKLLASRAAQYDTLASRTLDVTDLREPIENVGQFLKHVTNQSE